MLAHGERRRDSRQHFHQRASQSRIPGSGRPKQFPADETARKGLPHHHQPRASWTVKILLRHVFAWRVRSCGRRCEKQQRGESSEFRWRRNSSLHTLHVGRVTCRPRSCLKNASSPACQRWFHSSPHAGTSERVWVATALADLQRDVCRPGEALPENFYDCHTCCSLDTPQPGSGSLGIDLSIPTSLWCVSSQTPQRHLRHISKTSASQRLPHGFGRLAASISEGIPRERRPCAIILWFRLLLACSYFSQKIKVL